MAATSAPARHPIALQWEARLAEDPEGLAEIRQDPEGQKFLNWARARFIKERVGNDGKQIRQILTDLGVAREVAPGAASPEARKGSFWGAVGGGAWKGITGSAVRAGIRAMGGPTWDPSMASPEDVAIDPATAWKEDIGGFLGATLLDPTTLIGGPVIAGAKPLVQLGKAALTRAMGSGLGKALLTPAGGALRQEAARMAARTIQNAPGQMAAGAAIGGGLPAAEMLAGDERSPWDIPAGAALGAGLGGLTAGIMGPQPKIKVPKRTPKTITPIEPLGPERQLPGPGQTSKGRRGEAAIPVRGEMAPEDMPIGFAGRRQRPAPVPAEPAVATPRQRRRPVSPEEGALRRDVALLGRRIAELEEKRGYSGKPLTAEELATLDDLRARQDDILRSFAGRPTKAYLKAYAAERQFKEPGPPPYPHPSQPLMPGALWGPAVSPDMPLRPGALAPPAPLRPQLRINEPGAGMVPSGLPDRPLVDINTPVPVPQQRPSTVRTWSSDWTPPAPEGFPPGAPGDIPGIPPEPRSQLVDFAPAPTPEELGILRQGMPPPDIEPPPLPPAPPLPPPVPPPGGPIPPSGKGGGRRPAGGKPSAPSAPIAPRGPKGKGPKARLGKAYTVANGSRFQRIVVADEGQEFVYDIKMREGYKGVPKGVTEMDVPPDTSYAKSEALRQHATRNAEVLPDWQTLRASLPPMPRQPGQRQMAHFSGDPFEGVKAGSPIAKRISKELESGDLRREADPNSGEVGWRWRENPAFATVRQALRPKARAAALQAMETRLGQGAAEQSLISDTRRIGEIEMRLEELRGGARKTSPDEEVALIEELERLDEGIRAVEAADQAKAPQPPRALSSLYERAAAGEEGSVALDAEAWRKAYGWLTKTFEKHGGKLPGSIELPRGGGTLRRTDDGFTLDHPAGTVSVRRRGTGATPFVAELPRRAPEVSEPPRPTSGIAEPPAIPAAPEVTTRPGQLEGQTTILPDEAAAMAPVPLAGKAEEQARLQRGIGATLGAKPGAAPNLPEGSLFGETGQRSLLGGKPLGQYESGELARPPENLGERTKQRLRGMRTIETGGETGGTTRRLTTEPPPAPPPPRRSRPVRVEPAATGATSELTSDAGPSYRARTAMRREQRIRQAVEEAPREAVPNRGVLTPSPRVEVAGSDITSHLRTVATPGRLQALLAADEPAVEVARGGRSKTNRVFIDRIKEMGFSKEDLKASRFDPDELPTRIAKVWNERQVVTKLRNELLDRHLQGQSTEADRALFFRTQAYLTNLEELGMGMRAAWGRGGTIMQAFQGDRTSPEEIATMRRLLEQWGGSGEAFMDAVAKVRKAKGDAEAAKIARKILRPGAMQVLNELFVNSILSGIPTHAANNLANALATASRVGETAVAAGFGAAREAIGRAPKGDRVYGVEVREQLRGLGEGAADALTLAWHTLRKTPEAQQPARLKTAWKPLPGETAKEIHPPAITGEGTGALLRGGVPLPKGKHLPIPGGRSLAEPAEKAVALAGKVVRVPGAALVAEDAFWKSVHYRMTLRQMAARVGKQKGLGAGELDDYIKQVMVDPPVKLIAAARRAADHGTFNQSLNGPGWLRSLGRKAIEFRAEHPGAGFIFPFVRTPVNVAKHAQERTPLAVLDKDMRGALLGKQGAAQQDLAWAKLGTGMAMAAGVYELARQGNLTGGGPRERHERETWMNAGNKPYSIKLGDQWVQYNRLAPFGIIAGTAADVHEAREVMKEDDQVKLGALAVRALVKNWGEQTMLAGLITVANTLSDPDRYGGKFLENLFGATVPTILAKGAQTLDPTLRDVQDLNDKIVSRIPWVSQTVRPKLTALGDEIKREGGAGIFLWPGSITSEEARQDPVYNELLRLKVNLGRVESKANFNGREVELTSEDVDTITREAGQAAKARIAKRIETSGWSRLLDDTQADLIRNIVRRERARVRYRILRQAQRREAP